MLFRAISFAGGLLASFVLISAAQAITTDVVIANWAAKKYDATEDCRMDDFIAQASRKTQAIAAQIYKNGPKNYTLKNWIATLKSCDNVNSERCFVEADLVLHEEMEKLATQFGCQQKDVRNTLIKTNCTPGTFQSSVTSSNGEKIQLCSLKTKCGRTALFENGSYNLKCQVSSASCEMTNLQNCRIFRFESDGWFNDKNVPLMSSPSAAGVK